jgi:hypothetical protein
LLVVHLTNIVFSFDPETVRATYPTITTGNFIPIITTAFVRILQLDFLSPAPFTHASSHPLVLGLKASIIPRHCPSFDLEPAPMIPIITTVPFSTAFFSSLLRLLSMYPFVHIHLRDAGRDIMQFYYDLEAARNCDPIILAPSFEAASFWRVDFVRPFIRMFTRLVDAVIQGIMSNNTDFVRPGTSAAIESQLPPCVRTA